jgi:hypothetical protein
MENKKEIKQQRDKFIEDINYDRDKLLRSIDSDVINEIKNTSDILPKKLSFIERLLYIFSSK